VPAERILSSNGAVSRVQQRERPPGQQDPVAVGEPAKCPASCDQLVNPPGEALLDLDECGGEPARIGVEDGWW
jgi:hypothetical protein